MLTSHNVASPHCLVNNNIGFITIATTLSLFAVWSRYPIVGVVGYGTDDTKGDFWIIKNSWGTAFADGGYVYMARGVNCANILEADAGLYTVGPPELYYPWA